MSLIVWSDEYCVGIQNIDEQHQKLIQMINNLNDAIQDKKNRDTLDSIITEIYFYYAYHFGYEEAMMDGNDYNQFENHKGIHQQFVHTLDRLKDEFEHGAKDISVEILAYLQKWITSHIREVDREYCAVVT
ncbi:MAG: hemerythrin family protein [candidate division Zixibacteria bacterium]|nr:hemerythrin family protein [candidate division Zixibacteria bacterium]